MAEETPPISLRGLVGTAGTGSVAAGAAVLVQDNGLLALWLLFVGALSLIAYWRFDWLVRSRAKRGILFWSGAALMVVLVLSGGAAAFIYGVEGNGNTVDEAARRQAQSAQEQTAALRTELASRTGDLTAQIKGLEAQVRAAMEFQKNEKTDRDARDNAATARLRQEAERISKEKQRLLSVLKTLDEYRQRWITYQAKAAPVCVREDIGTLPSDFSTLSRVTTEMLTTIGYPQYRDDFADTTRCPQFVLSSICGARNGYNEEAVSYFNRARCRLSNLRSIIDEVRREEAAIR